MREPLRVLHAPTDVGGNPVGLARAERSLGLDSTVAVNRRSWLRYPVDVDLGIEPGRRSSELSRRLAFFLKSAGRYDVYHFNFGQTFLPAPLGLGIDLPILRLLGGRVFMTWQGCDARQAGFCARTFEIACCDGSDREGLCRVAEDPAKRRRIGYVSRFAHRVFAVNPDLLHVLPEGAEFVPYSSVRPDEVTVAERRVSGRPVVLHAPTNRAVKGTDAILAACTATQQTDPFDLRLVENVVHEEALRLYRDADIVIDQVRVGWYGGFAVEAMAMGKPVICYIREDDLKFVPRAMAADIPVVNAGPDGVAAALRRLLRDPTERARVGERSRRYVERWHDPVRIARRMVAVYRDPRRRFWDG